MRDERWTPLRLGVVATLLLLGLFLQVRFLRSYPQPILFGDPGAYYVFGQKFQDAASLLLSGHPLTEVYDAVRGYGYFAGVGVLYGAIDAVDPGDIETFRLLLALVNVMGMLGAFYLARDLSARFLGGALALGLAAVYPAFSLQLGRLFPDPVVGALVVWSAYFASRGLRSRRPGLLAASGATLTMALFVRAQMFDYVVLVLAAVAVLAAPWWLRSSAGRSAVLAFALGALPLTLLSTALVRGMDGDFSEIERYGFFALPQQQRYPYGFWMFLDSDGWLGPYGVEEYPFYRAMEAEAAETPSLLDSRPRQYLFAARYVARRPLQAAGMVADNVYRLFTEVANQYRWDYPVPVGVQRAVQAAVVVLGLASLALFASRAPSRAFSFFMPAAVGLLHGLSFPEARYNQPVMLVLIAGAGAYLAWLAGALRGRPLGRSVRFGLLAAAALAAALVGEAMRPSLPLAGRSLRLLGLALAIAIPFLLVLRLEPSSRSRRLWVVGTAGLLFTLVAIHAARDRLWHGFSLGLGDDVAGVEQDIRLSGPALSKLRSAESAWIFVDLHAADGDLSRLRVRVNGEPLDSRELVATMPRFGTATVSGGRNPRGFPQWWAFPVTGEMLGDRAPAELSVSLAAEPGASIRIFADRFPAQDRIYEGPSFGSWPRYAMLKLVHDGDYRIPFRAPLESAGTESFLLSASGERTPMPGVLRVRLLAVDDVEGELSWATERVPPDADAVAAFFGYSGGARPGTLSLDGDPVLDFPLGGEDDFTIERPPFRFCYRATGPRGDMAYGGYVLAGPLAAGRPNELGVRFRAAPGDGSIFFSLDRGRSAADLAELAAACGAPEGAPVVNGAAEVLDASRNAYPDNVGPWKPGGVF